MCLGHALSRHGRLQPTSSTAPMGLPQLNDKIATIQRAGCVFLDHVLIAIKNFRRQYIWDHPQAYKSPEIHLGTRISHQHLLQMKNTMKKKSGSGGNRRCCQNLSDSYMVKIVCMDNIVICILSCRGAHMYTLPHSTYESFFLSS